MHGPAPSLSLPLRLSFTSPRLGLGPLALALGLIVLGPSAVTAQDQTTKESGSADLVARTLDTSRTTLASNREALQEDSPPVSAFQRRETKIQSGLLNDGLHDEALALLGTRSDASAQEFAQALDILYRFADTEALQHVWSREVPLDEPLRRRCRYDWLFFTDDLAGVRELVETQKTLLDGELHAVDRLAAGRLDAATFEHERARHHYESVVASMPKPNTEPLDADLSSAHSGRLRGIAEAGLADIAYRQRDFDGALEHILEALAFHPLDPDFLYQFALVLIRHGRTDDAIAAVELAVEAAPFHERAHYLLGNGYARKNYTQLEAAYPDLFAGPSGFDEIDAIDDVAKSGHAARARDMLRNLHQRRPQWVEVMARLGSMDYMEGRQDDAITWFRGALDTCPEYGRAHNGLAKAIEAKRLSVEVHRPLHESDFAEQNRPQVAMIEDLVINWHELRPRHQKQVALSVEPWARFVPAIVAGGSTYYIKPLHELLSETPGQHSLRDQRISYDSRLWDDVRGCGGYHTVTGIEDVERTVLGRYNTVLHELTHQVHGILSADRRRQIEHLYQETKRRDQDLADSGTSAFLSRYAGGSVWEYFAEGANALASPRRDDFDTREIVRERLLEIDPALTGLVRRLMEDADIDSCYPVAYVNRGYRQLEDAKVDEALQSCRLALEHDGNNESALAALVYVLQLADSSQTARDWAERALSLHPTSAAIVTTYTTARWHAGDPLNDVVRDLAARRDGVRENDRREVDQELGRLYHTLGDTQASLAAYEQALEAQADSPEALWGRARVLASAGRFAEAWAVYEEAVRARTGIIELRWDYATDLLEAGEIGQAVSQVREAVLLDAEDPLVTTLESWLALEQDDLETALSKSALSIETGPWLGIAWWVRARALERAGQVEEAREALSAVKSRIDANAPPTYVFREKWGRYDEAWTLPANLRAKVAHMWTKLEDGVDG